MKKAFNSFLFLAILLSSFFISKNIYAQSNKDKSLIQIADSLYEAQNYIEAKAYYQYLLRINKQDVELKQKLNSTLEILRSQQELRTTYADFIISADLSYQDKELDKALSAYQSAAELFPSENYPKNQIERINQELKLEYELLEEYNVALATAQEYINAQDYANAKIEIQYALSLIPGDKNALNELSKIEVLLEGESEKSDFLKKLISSADSLFFNKNYNQAEAGYQNALNLDVGNIYVQNQLNLIASILAPIDRYNTIIAQADNYYEVRDFRNAGKHYDSALMIKPSDSYVLEMLKKSREALALKKTTAKEDYDQAILLGNKHFKSNEWGAALQQYEFASRLFPNDELSLKKISEINEKLDELQRQDSLNLVFEDLVSKADLFFEAGEYDQSKELYQQAQEINPENANILTQLNNIESELNKAKLAQELKNNYIKSIGQADSLYQIEEFAASRDIYNYANSIEESTYANSQIEIIDSILLQKERIRIAEKNYQTAISKADSLFNLKRFKLAESAYKEALTYQPNESYPASQIEEIAIQIELHQKEIDKQFNAIILDAKKEAEKGHLQNAIALLKSASEVKPEDTQPDLMIQQINQRIKESKERALNQYEPLLTEANQNFTQKQYDRALALYIQAANLLPNEVYPQNRIKEIVNIIEGAKIRDVVEADDMIAFTEQKKFEFSSLNITDRKESYLLLKINNPEETKNLRIILNYGKDQMKNGGFVVRLYEKTSHNYYLLKIGKQYKWFNADNNWISIQPQGGQIELSSIIISKPL